MRKLFILPILFIGVAISGICQSPSDDSKKLGLVAYLTYVKAKSEAKMLENADNPEYMKNPALAFEVNGNYNKLKLETDQLINQMSADLISKNGLGTYNSVNKTLKDPTYKTHIELKPYLNLISKIDTSLNDFLAFEVKENFIKKSTEEIMGVVTFGHTAITDARNFRQKKVASIVGVMNELKLTSIGELLKGPKKD